MHWLSLHYPDIQVTLVFVLLTGCVLVGLRTTQRKKGSPKNSFDMPILGFTMGTFMLLVLFEIFVR